MKPLIHTLAVMAALATSAYADHHPHQGGHAPEKPCKMMLGKDGTPQPCPMMKHGMGGGHSMMDMTLKGADTPASREFMETNKTMHDGMNITFSGDADIDFLKGMIAHHQGAVEMAQTQLKYGTDAQVRRLSYDIIRAQKLEISWMQSWLKELEAVRQGKDRPSPLGKNNFWQ